jgi:hypothetical protein
MKERVKQISASLLAAIMVFTFMPVFGLGGYDYGAYAATRYTARNTVTVDGNQYLAEVPYTGEILDLSKALETITLTNNAVLTYGEEFTAEAAEVGPGPVDVLFTTIGQYADDTIRSGQIYVAESTPADTYSVTIDESTFVYDGTAIGWQDVERATTVIRNDVQNIPCVNNQAAKGRYTIALSGTTTGAAGTKPHVVLRAYGVTDPIWEGDLTVQKANLADLTLTATMNPALVYNGSALTGTLSTVTWVNPANNQTASIPVSDLATPSAADYSNNINAGTNTAKVKITAKATAANYTGTGEATFSIGQYDIDNAWVGFTKKSVEFNGTRQTPEIPMTVAFKNEYGAKDIGGYKVVYAVDSTNVGTYAVTLEPETTDGNLTGSKKVAAAYDITAADLGKATKTQKNAVPAGTTLTKTNVLDYFDISVNGYSLVSDDIQSVNVTGTTTKKDEVCTVTVTPVTGGNLKNTASFTYTTAAVPIAGTFEASKHFTYSGSAQTPTKLGTLTQVSDGVTTTLSEGTDYEVISDWSNNVNAGTALVTVQGKGEYEGRAIAEFTIDPLAVSSDYAATVTGINRGVYYEGAEIEGASVVLKKTGATDITPTDFTVVASTLSNDPSKLTGVTVTLGGNYSGTFTATVNVIADTADLGGATVTGSIPAGLKVYDSDAVKRYITVKVGDTEITSPAYNVTITNSSATDFGKLGTNVTFNITPKVAQVTGEKKNVSVPISAADIAALDVTSGSPAVATISVASAGTYNGVAKTPAVTVASDSGLVAGTYFATVAEGTDYTVSYDNNKNAGTATVTLTGKGNFEGSSVTKEFTIGKCQLDGGQKFALELDEKADTSYDPDGIRDLSSSLKVVNLPSTSSSYEQWKNLEFNQDDFEIKLAEGNTNAAGNNVNYNITLKSTSQNYYVSRADRVFSRQPYSITQKTVKTSNSEVEIENVQFVVGTTSFAPGTVSVKVDGKDVPTNQYIVRPNTGVWNAVTSTLSDDQTPPKWEITFRNNSNYAGKLQKDVTIVAAEKDITTVKLVAPTGSATVYSGSPIGVQAFDKSKQGLVEGTDFEVWYTGGDLTDAQTTPPTKSGTYTATVKATESAGGATGESIEYTIEKQHLTSVEFKLAAAMIEGSFGNVAYFATLTESPTIPAVFADDFEVLSYDTTWDGDPANLGKATIALKADANYVYAGEETVEFQWVKGNLASHDVNDYFEILDQEYTGAAVEPTVQPKAGCDVPEAWVTYASYSDNINTSKKSAKANIVVTAPADSKLYTGKQSGTIVFGIVTAAQAVEDAEAAKTAAEVIDDTYPAVAKKAVDEAKATLERELISGDTDKIIAATKALNEAVEAAKSAKTDVERAADEAVKAAASYTEANYTPASVKAVTEAAAAVTAAKATGDSNKIAEATAALSAAMKNAVAKKANTLSVKGKTVKAKKSKTKKIKASKAYKVTGAQGTVTYEKVKVNKSKANKKIKVDATTGKITVKKGLKKGTYKLTVKVKAAGNDEYLAGEKTVTLKVKVK